jgi:hypothetical protein
VNGGELPFELTLQLANEAFVDTPPIILWQLGLQLVASESAVGSLEFEAVSPPEGSLFGQDPGPGPPIETPVDEIVVSDADTGEFSGVVIPAQADVPIVKLILTVSSDAEGLFTLIMAGFDTGDIDHSSHWLFTPDFEPTPFDNTMNEPMRVELATIRVSTTNALLGDFNGDQVVDASDYPVWRNSLGADFDLNGNGDESGASMGIVDAADYALWKLHYGEPDEGGAGGTTNVPEPPSVGLMVAIIVEFSLFNARFIPNRHRRSTYCRTP